MTQVIRVTLNSMDCGTRFAYPFRFDLRAALRGGANTLELTHTERYGFTSQLGDIRVQPYYELTV